MIINTFFTALSEMMHIKCLAHECSNMVMVEAGQELNKENIAFTCLLWVLKTFSGLCILSHRVGATLWKVLGDILLTDASECVCGS